MPTPAARIQQPRELEAGLTLHPRVSRTDVPVLTVESPAFSLGAVPNRVIGERGDSPSGADQDQGAQAFVGVTENCTVFDHLTQATPGRSAEKESFGPTPPNDSDIALRQGGFLIDAVSSFPVGSPMGKRLRCRDQPPGTCTPVAPKNSSWRAVRLSQHLSGPHDHLKITIPMPTGHNDYSLQVEPVTAHICGVPPDHQILQGFPNRGLEL